MSAKQHRPIEEYVEQFENKEVEQSESLRSELQNKPLQNKQGTATTPIPPNTELPFENPINPYGPEDPRSFEEQDAYTADKAGYLQQRYKSELLKYINKGGEDRKLLNSDPRFNPEDALVVSTKEEILEKSGIRNVWNALQQNIDAIQISATKGEILEATNRKNIIEEDIKNSGGVPTEDQLDALQEIDDDIADYEQDIKENEIEHKAASDYLGKYGQHRIDQDVANPGAWPDSWMELAHHLGGTMSEIQAMGASMAAPYIAGKATALVGATVGLGATIWSGPGAAGGVTVGGTIGFAVGFGGALAAQLYSRNRESYAEMHEAFESKIEGEKRKYRLLNNGKEMPEEELAALEKQTMSTVGAVYDLNQNLFATDVIEAGIGFLPWSKFKNFLPTGKWGRRAAYAGAGAGGVGVGAYWEGREEGDQFLIKNGYLRGDYDDLERLESIVNSMGLAAETTGGMVNNSINRILDYRVAGGRTESKEFKASVDAGVMLGGVMGGTRTVGELGIRTAQKVVDNQMYGSDAEDFVEQVYDRYMDAEHNKAMSEWLFTKLQEKGGAKKLNKLLNKIEKSFPDIAEKMDMPKAREMVLVASAIHSNVNQEKFKSLSVEDKSTAFRALISNYSTGERLAEDISNAESEIQKVIAGLPAPTTEKEQGMSELIALKAELNVARAKLKRIKALPGTTDMRLAAINKIQEDYYTKILKGTKATEHKEAVPGLEKQYKTMLEQHGHTTTKSIPLNKDLQDLNNTAFAAKASKRENDVTRELIQSASNGETLMANPFIQDFGKTLERPEVKEKEPTIAKQNQEGLEENALVEYKDSNGQAQHGNLRITTDQEGNATYGVWNGEIEVPVERDNITLIVPIEEVKAENATSHGKQQNAKNEKKEQEAEKAKKAKEEEEEGSDDVDDLFSKFDEPVVPVIPVVDDALFENAEETAEEHAPEETGEVKADVGPEVVVEPEVVPTVNTSFENAEKVEHDNQDGNSGPKTEENTTEEEAVEPEPSFTDAKKPISLIGSIRNGIHITDLFLKYINSLPSIFFENKEVRYEIDFDSKYWYASSIIKDKYRNKITPPKDAPVGDLAKLHINVWIKDPKTGVEYSVNLQSGLTGDQSNKEATALLRRKIYKQYVAGEPAFGTISKYQEVRAFWNELRSRDGVKENIGEHFSIKSLFPDGPVVLGVKNDFEITGGGTTVGFDTGTKANNGVVYAMVVDPATEEPQSVKLNQRGLNENEVFDLLDILEFYKKARSKSSRYWRNEIDTGLSILQYLEMLTYSFESREYAKQHYTLGAGKGFSPFINTALVIEENQAYFYDGEAGDFVQLTESTKEQFIAWALANKKRQVHSTALNKSIFDIFTSETMSLKKRGSIVFQGVTYLEDEYDKYNEHFLTENNSEDVDMHVMRTDTKLDDQLRPKHLVHSASKFIFNTEVHNKSREEKEEKKKEDTKTAAKKETTNEGHNFQFGDDMENLSMEVEVGDDTSEKAPKEKFNEIKARAYLKRVLGDTVPVNIQKSLISLGRKGAYAYGVFRKGMITLSEQAVHGAEYHEAYHAVEELWLAPEQRRGLDIQTRQQFGVPTKAMIKEIQSKHKDITEEVAEAIYYSEIRAEEYRYWETTGETAGVGEKVIRWFKYIKALVGYMMNPKTRMHTDLLFYRMSAGYYANTKPISAKVEAWRSGKGLHALAMERLPLDPRTVEQTVNITLHHYIDNAGGIGGVHNIKDIESFEANAKESKKLHAFFKAYLEFKVKRAETIENEKPFLNARKLLLREVDVLVEHAELRLQQLGIRENEETRKDNADVLAASKSPFETSGKQNATTTTRVFFSFLPLFDKNGELVTNVDTGLPVMANPGHMWNTVEALLADTVTYTNEQGKTISSYDQMMVKLETLSVSDRTFESLYTRVKALPINERTQFFNAMSKSNSNFLTVLYQNLVYEVKGQVQKSLLYKFIDPQQQGKAYRIRDRWFENHKELPLYSKKEDKEGNLVITANKDVAARNSAMWLQVMLDLRNEGLTASTSHTTRIFLEHLGIEMSEEGLEQAFNLISPEFKTARRIFIGGMSKLMGTGSTYSMGTLAGKGKNKGNVAVDFVENHMLKESFVMKLAAGEAVVTEDFGQTTILGPEGKTYWIYSLNNFFKKRTLQMNRSSYYADELLKSPYHGQSQLLKQLKKGKKLVYKTFNTYKKQGGNDHGTDYKGLNPADEYTLRVNMTLKHTYSPATMADKGVWMLYKGVEYLTPSDINMIEYNKKTDTYIIPPHILKIFSTYAVTEMAAIYQADLQLFGKHALTDSQLIENYHYKGEDKKTGKLLRENANGTKFVTFPSFNDEEFLQKIGFKVGKTIVHPVIKDLLEKPAFVSKMTDIINDRIRAEVGTALRYSTIQTNPNGGLKNHAIATKTFSAFSTLDGQTVNEAGEIVHSADVRTRRAIAAFGLNSIISNLEAMQVYAGNPAFYFNMDELSKRMPSLIAPGQDLNLAVGEEFFKMAVLRDIEEPSAYFGEYLASYKAANKKHGWGFSEADIKRILKPYSKVNQADGQGYISLERWAFIMKRLGRWDNSKIDEIYKRLLAGAGTAKDMKFIAAMPLKGMHYELRPYKGLMVPTYIKYSQAVLFPQVVKGTDKLETLYATMTDKTNPIDEVIFESGIKVGAQSPKHFTGEGKLKLNVMTLRNEYWKLQQDLRPHTASESLEGSQVKRNLLANIRINAQYTLDGKKVTGQNLIKQAHDIDRELSNMGKDKLYEEFGITTNDEGDPQITDYTKLHELIYKEFSKKESTPRKLLDSLELRADKRGFLRPLHSHPYADKIDQLIGSIITARTVKLKMPGGSYIQLSNFGFKRTKRWSSLTDAEKAEIEMVTNPNDLKPGISEVNKGGEFVKFSRAQIMLPSWFRDLIPNYEKMSSAEIQKYISDKRLLRGIAYRIPNQGMSSIDAFEVVGFLPKSMGDAVVAYDDITAKTGSDFDIDKMFIMLPNFGVDKNSGKPYYIEYKESMKGPILPPTEKQIEAIQEKNKKGTTSKEKATEIYYSKKRAIRKKALQNRKLEIYDAVISDPKTYIDLITPLDSIGVKFRAAKVRFFENYTTVFDHKMRARGEALIAADKLEDFIKFVTDAMSVKGDLEWFSASFQVDVKQQFVGGKTGVALTARQLVDHAISQFSLSDNVSEESPLYFSENLGIGNKTKSGFSDLSQIYNTAKGTITNIISGRLNAYVDIAKDPYIFYLNNNEFTANTVFLLDRLGANPEWTDMFMSQPILKEWVEYAQYTRAGNTKRIWDEKTKKTLTDKEAVLRDYKKKYIETMEGEGMSYINAEKAFKDEIKNINSKFGSNTLKLDNLLNISTLEEGIKNKEATDIEHIIHQLTVVETFFHLRQRASVLSSAIGASKQDVEGAGGGMVNSLVSERKLSDALQDTGLRGIAARFENTMLAKYRDNSTSLMLSLFKDSFNIGSAGFGSALWQIEEMSNNEYFSKNPEKLRRAYRDLYSMYLAKKAKSLTQEKFQELVISDNNIVNQLAFWQTSSKSPIKENRLIKYLLASKGNISNIKDEIGSITVPNTQEKDGVSKDLLTEAWEQLYLHEDKKVQAFAKDLALYSFIVSGYTNKLFSFHELMPLSLEDELFDRFNEEANTIEVSDGKGGSAVVSDTTDPGLFSRAELDIFFRNNSHNTDLVPEISDKFAEKVTSELGLEVYGFATGDTSLVKTELIDGREEVTRVTKYVTVNERLYRHAGWNSKQLPVYVVVNKLGKNDRGKTLFEPFLREGKGSNINTNNIILLDKALQKNVIVGTTFATKKLKEAGILVEVELSTSPNETTDVNTLFHLEENSFLNEVERAATLMENAADLQSVFDGKELKPSDKEFLAENGFSQDEIDIIERWLQRNALIYKGKPFNVLMAYRFSSLLEGHKDIVAKMQTLGEKADKKLDNYLADFLEEYGVIVTERSMQDMEERYGEGVLGVAHTLRKVIDIAKEDRTKMVMPEEFSHMLVDLVGVKSDLIKPLMQNITSWGKFGAIKRAYAKNRLYQNIDGSPNMEKIKKEAIGQIIGEAIIYANEKRVPKGKFLKLAYEAYEAILKIAKSIASIPVEIMADEIAQQVLSGDKKFMETYGRAKDKNFTLKTFEEGATKFPKAFEVMETAISKLNAVLVGSLALRSQGNVYRDKAETLHDLDFVIPESKRHFDTIQEVVQWLETDVKKEIPNFIPIYVFRPEKDEKIVVNAIITTHPHLVEKFVSLKGNFNKRLDKFTKEEQSQMLLIDFFLNTEHEVVTEQGHASWVSIFEAKFSDALSRDKDYYDHRNFIPHDNENREFSPAQESDFVFLHFTVPQIFAIGNKYLNKGTLGKGKDKKLQKKGKYFYGFKHDHAKSANYIGHINNTVFNKSPVLKLVRTERGMRAQIRPEKYISKDDLNDDPHTKDNCK